MYVDSLKRNKESTKNKGLVRQIILAVLPGLFVCGAVLALANVYYNLDLSGGMVVVDEGDINVSTNLRTGGTIRIDSSGNLTNIGNITGSGAMTISSGGSSPLTLDSASGLIVLNDNLLFEKGTYDVTFSITTPTANRTITFPDNSGTVAVSASLPITLSSEGVIGLSTPLSVSYGGTGISSVPSGALLYGSGGEALNTLSIGTSGYILTSDGSSPYWTSPSSLSILTGTGTTNYIPKWTGTTTLANSIITDDGSLVTVSGQFKTTGTTTLATSGGNVGIGTTSPGYKLDVQGGDINVSTNLRTGGTIRIDSSGNLTNIGNITGSGAMTISSGGSSPLTLDSASGLIVLNDNLLFEKGTYDVTFSITTPTANRTITFPDNSGTVAVSASLPITLSSEGVIGLSTPLSVSYGGTGISSVPSGALLYGSGGEALNTLSIGTSGYILTSDGSSPYWTSPSSLLILTGTGTTNYLPKWTGSYTLSNSIIYENNTNVGISTQTPARKLDILDSSNPQLRISQTDGTVYAEFFVDSNGDLTITTTGDEIFIDDHLKFSTDNTYDIGASSANRPRTIYVATSIVTGNSTTLTTNSLSSTQDLRISSGGTSPLTLTSASGTLILGTGTNTITNTDASTDLIIDPTGNLIIKGSTSDNTTFALNVQNSSGTSLLYVRNDGNIGIGTTTPAYALDIVGDINLSATGVIRIAGNAGSEGQYLRRTASGMVWDTVATLPAGDTEGQVLRWNNTLQNWFPTSTITISSDGNVGIGTTAPNAKLQVVGGAIMPAVGNSATAGLYWPTNPGGGSGDEAFIRYFVESGETTKLMIGINNDADDRLSLYQMGAERLTIYNGNVGIGTTAPAQKLTVAGNIGIQAGANAFIGTLDNYALSLRTNNADRIFIDATGNVGIGTTAPTRKLDILDASNPQIRLTQTSGSIYGELKVDSAGDLTIAPSGDEVFIPDDNLRICAGGACPAASYSGTGNLQVEGRVQIDAPAGTAPLIVNSTTVVTNLNADLLDGKHSTGFQGASDCECIYSSCSTLGCTATATCPSGKYIVEVILRNSSNQCLTIANPCTTATYMWGAGTAAACIGATSCTSGTAGFCDPGYSAQIAVICCR